VEIPIAVLTARIPVESPCRVAVFLIVGAIVFEFDPLGSGVAVAQSTVLSTECSSVGLRRRTDGRQVEAATARESAMESIPEAFEDLFERATFAHFATMTPTGYPHVTPVWIDYDAAAGRLLVNTERGRRKAKNVEANPKVGVSMTDPDDPYRFLSVFGEVDEITTEGARDHIDTLAKRYVGEEEYPNPIRTERIVLRIRPDRVFSGG
jgi:PPOX class probable F420-dependent enzyme